MPLPFELTILGNNSAIPAHGRHPSAQLLTIHNQHILIDCGEGTQMRLPEVGAKPFKLEYIFISHLHGDHFFGLFGLLTSMSLFRREKDLHIYAHKPLKGIVEKLLEVTKGQMSYTIHYHDLPESGEKLLLETKDFEVRCFQLDHRVPCCGFKFTERFSRKKLNVEKLEHAGVPKFLWGELQRGKDVIMEDNSKIIAADYTLEGPKPRSYAYCSDTKFTLDFVDAIKGTDTIYVDSTFMKDDTVKAGERYHCTTTQAATIAKTAKVGRLLLGHYSSKYKELEPLLAEAQEVFEATELSEEGKTFKIELW